MTKTHEPQTPYDTEAETAEAMTMLGTGYEPAAIIEQPRSQLVLRDGIGQEWTVAWVKLSTAFKPHIKELRGAPLAVWLFIVLSINRDGVAFPGIRTIAEEIGYSHQGVLDAIATLEEKGYLKVTRGERRFNLYEPEFAAIGRTNEPTKKINSDESTKLTGQVCHTDESTFSPNESSPLDLNKINKREQESLSPEEIEEANHLADAIIGSSEKGRNLCKFRSQFRDNHLSYLDWWFSVSGMPAAKGDVKSCQKAFADWQDRGLTVRSLQDAHENQKKWRVVSDPNMLTKDATAIQVMPEPEETRPEYKPYVDPNEGKYAPPPPHNKPLIGDSHA